MFASAREAGKGGVAGGRGAHMGLNSKQCRLWKTAGCAEVYTRAHIIDEGMRGGLAGWLAG